MICEFTVLNFANLLQKLDRFWISFINSKLKASRGIQNGHNATINQHGEKRRKGIEKIPIDVIRNKKIRALEEADSRNDMSDDIRKHLKPNLNKTNIGMRKIIKEVLGVEQSHAIVSEKFDKEEDFT